MVKHDFLYLLSSSWENNGSTASDQAYIVMTSNVGVQEALIVGSLHTNYASLVYGLKSDLMDQPFSP